MNNLPLFVPYAAIFLVGAVAVGLAVLALTSLLRWMGGALRVSPLGLNGPARAARRGLPRDVRKALDAQVEDILTEQRRMYREGGGRP